jgi:multisubunit Na+/H+ antiporter MnhG subunit
MELKTRTLRGIIRSLLVLLAVAIIGFFSTELIWYLDESYPPWIVKLRVAILLFLLLVSTGAAMLGSVLHSTKPE